MDKVKLSKYDAEQQMIEDYRKGNFEPDGGCSCHINPPCSTCESLHEYLDEYCDEYGIEIIN